MITLIITFCAFLLIISAMAIGAIVANKPIKGSCGGLSALGLKEDCLICGGTDSKASRARDSHKPTDDLFYDAMAVKNH
ncbi:(Na+)-NQR maturation NqrM [Candidatus Sororendozoicomonas aggregata]|uniref:(Na+)-NQR maturation NqrM n=1 Tax=Candidatus Sororendozoicomonas aggregata TaxID=3073239 RepID=UPI002ED4144B